MVCQQSQLFLAITLDHNLFLALKQAPPSLQELLIQQNNQYLTLLKYNNRLYLGKFIKNLTPLNKISTFEQHIISLISKLLPHLQIADVKTLLIPMLQSEYTLSSIHEEVCLKKS